jgi:hypothetical protein
MDRILPAFADGLSQFFGAIVTINAVLPIGADGGNIKTVQ